MNWISITLTPLKIIFPTYKKIKHSSMNALLMNQFKFIGLRFYSCKR